MRKIYTLLLLILSVTVSYSQNEANNWYFGQKAGVTFNSGVPVALTNGQLTTLEGCSSISDASGNLLFYTDGIKVWNKSHAVMANGTNLKGDPSSTQSGIIVPKPGSSTIYYIFTVDMQGGLALFAGGDADGVSNGLMYSEVDMTLNGGLGNITATKNIALKKPTTEGLAAVKHANGVDYWVVTHGTNDNKYYSFLVTAAGVNAVPVVSSVGPTVTVSAGNYGAGAIGYMKISPNGKKIAACHSYENNDLVISDFNSSTGAVSNSITINLHLDAESDGPYGVEFSSCNEYLYVTEQFTASDFFWGTSWPRETRIWRFDLNAGSIPASKSLFQLVANESLGALQLASDTKIYCARIVRTGSSAINYNYGFGTTLHVINNPRIAGATFTANAVNLAGRTSAYGLPPFISSFFYNPNFSFSNVATGDTALFCNGDSIQFKGTTNAYDSVRWYFGDPSTGINNTSVLLNPKHLFSTYGVYTIKFYKYLCGIKDSSSKNITIYQYPVITPLANQTICSGSVVLNGTSSPVTSYIWNTGATTPTITVSTQGGYAVRANNQGCISKDSMYLTVTPTTAVSVTISPSVNGVCAGTNVTFTATPSTSGLSPNYQWYLNGNPVGINSATYSNTSFSNNDQVKVVMTSAASCITGSPATSNTVVMNITPSTAISVSIVPDVNNVCPGTNVTFTATPSTSGLSPNYQWYLNGSPVGLNSATYSNTSFNNSDQVKVIMTSAASCITGSPATSNIVVMLVKPIPSVTVNSPSICSGLTAALNASGATSYTWTGGLSATSNPTTPILTTTTTYTVTGTTNGCTGTAVSTVTVNPKPSVTVNSPTICNGQTANLIANGATSYTWTGGLAATSNPTTPVLTTTTTYTVTGTTSGCTGTAVSTVTVNPSPSVTVNSPSICNGQTANLLANGAATYTWTGGLAAISNPTTPILTTTTTYTVTGTTSGCTGTAVSTVTVKPNPSVTINSPTICSGLTTTLNANGATAYTWTGGLAATSNPTTPILTTTTTYTVTGTTNGCTGTAVSTVTVNPKPSVTVNSPTICNGQTANLIANGAAGYTWTGGLAATSNPTTPVLTTTTTYTVTGTTAGCTGTAVSTVTVNPNPNVTVNSPNICPTQTANLLATGAATYTWTGGLASIANPTTPALTTTTTYTVTGTTNGCTGTAVATVSVNNNLVVNVNSPTICSGQTAVLNATGAAGYTWTGGLAATSNPTTPVLTTTTTYTVTGNTTGCTGTAVATVTVNPNPSVTVNSPAICSGQTANLLANGAAGYTWTGGLASTSNPTTPILTTTTSYTVTGTTNGCTGTAVSTVTVKPNPSVTVNSPAICSGQTANLLASGATSYTWTGGLAASSNPTTPALTTTTTYTVTGTTNGCTGTAVSSVTITPNPTVTVNSPSICSGQSAALNASGATSYTWTGGLASNSNPTTPVLTTTTTYTVTGTTGTCTGTAVSTVTVKPNPTVNVNNPSVCNGHSAAITASGATSYTWTGGLAAVSNPTTPVLTTTTTYTVTGTTNACTGTAVSIVTVKTTSATNLSRTVCQGQSVTVGSQTFSTTGNYTIVLQNSQGCDSTVSLNLTVNPTIVPVVSIASNKNDICAGDAIVFTATATNTGVTPSYQWQLNGVNVGTNSTQFSSSNLANGDVVKVVITTTATCANPTTATSNDINVIVNTIAYTKPVVLYCKNDSQAVDLLISTMPATPFTVTWTNGNNVTTNTVSTYTVNNSTSGNIPFEIRYGNNCKVNDVLPVTVNPLPNIDAISDLPRVKFEDTVQLNVSSSATIVTYNWTPASLVSVDSIRNPTSIIKASTVFTVHVKDNNNCSNSDTVYVEMIDECRNEFIYLPTAFSPNRDGINDCFGILSPPKLSDYKLTIFDRWGEKVFETNDEKACWDGTFKGIEAQSDSYIYLVSFKCYNGTVLSKKGTITIMR